MRRRGVEIGHENLVDYDARFSTLSKGKNLSNELANCASFWNTYSEKILFRLESHVVAKAKSLKAVVNLNSRDWLRRYVSQNIWTNYCNWDNFNTWDINDLTLNYSSRICHDVLWVALFLTVTPFTFSTSFPVYQLNSAGGGRDWGRGESYILLNEIQTMFSQLAKRSARVLPADLCADHRITSTIA